MCVCLNCHYVIDNIYIVHVNKNLHVNELMKCSTVHFRFQLNLHKLANLCRILIFGPYLTEEDFVFTVSLKVLPKGHYSSDVY